MQSISLEYLGLLHTKRAFECKLSELNACQALWHVTRNHQSSQTLDVFQRRDQSVYLELAANRLTDRPIVAIAFNEYSNNKSPIK